MKISSVCPILFNSSFSFEKEVDYIQRFHVADPSIIVQSVTSPGLTVGLQLNNLITNKAETKEPLSYAINENNTLYEFDLGQLPIGVYKIIISLGQERLESLPFSVCNSPDLLRETSLIEYSNANNATGFGAIFDLDGVKRSFALRVEAGFKSDAIKFNIENEQYRNQRQEIIETYAIPYSVKTFTIGDSLGVPVRVAELINNALCLSEFKIDGIPHRRSGNSAPEMKVISERFPQYNFSIDLEEALNTSYNGYIESPDGSSLPGNAAIQSINPKEGEVLRYSRKDGAFINSSKI